MAYTLLYHPAVRETDLPQINPDVKARIARAIESRLATEPQKYGRPLRKTLKGYWKLRVGDYRVIYKIVGDDVWILGIIHRKIVYEKAGKRLKSN
ncbi:MAG: type II toxin-antitoxin system RelE/ParE family toxin [bacterium]|nr:type II toxin-antitoxin system RelE/ParE family toxin [bacterium]